MAASLVTLNASTSTDVPGDPHYYVTRQGVFFALGTLIAIVLSRIDYSRLRELKFGVYGLMMFGLLLVEVFGGVTRGSRRAIELPFFEVQASELGKVLLIVALAGFVVDRSRHLGERDTTARLVLLGMFPAMFVMISDLGSGLVYVAITLSALYIAGVSWRHFAGLFSLGAIAITLVIVAAPALGVTVLKGYQVDRLTSFLHPSDVQGDAGYQQNQSAHRDRLRSEDRPWRALDAGPTELPSRRNARTSRSPSSASAGALPARLFFSRSTRCSCGAVCGFSPWPRTSTAR